MVVPMRINNPFNTRDKARLLERSKDSADYCSVPRKCWWYRKVPSIIMKCLSQHVVSRVAVGRSIFGCSWSVRIVFPNRRKHHYSSFPPYETSFDMGNNSEKGETQEPASINGIGPVCACRASFVLMEPGAVGRGPEALLQIAELLQAYSFAEN
jgi:hypothetical protein